MKVISDINAYKSEAKPLAVAVGNFDGVHVGHQEIFRLVVERAKSIGGFSAVLTFGEHPQHVLNVEEKPALLTSFYQKLSLLEGAGIDLCFVLKFTEEFSKKTPEVFVKEVLVGQLHAKCVCMGFNARFGYGRSGDVSFVRQMAMETGFEFLEAVPVQVDGVSVSSSSIRRWISEGDLKRVCRALGRPFSFYGTVVRGRGKGSEIGYATANLLPHSGALPPVGVYAVVVDLFYDELMHEGRGGFIHKKKISQAGLFGILNYGKRPTFSIESTPEPIAEVHLFDFQGDLTGKTLEVKFVKKIRDEQRFCDEKALKRQIEKDSSEAREILNHFGKNENDPDGLLAADRQKIT